MVEIEEMEEIVFECCGAVAWLPKKMLEEKRKTGATFYCPSGHPRCYKETEADRLRKELAQAKRDLADRESKLESVKAGKCPFCWRTVKDLGGHVRRRHK